MGTVDDFAVEVAAADDETHLRLRGELDMAAVDEFVRAFETVWASGAIPPGGVVVDVDGLTFLDSSGVRGMLQAAARCEKESKLFRVVGARGAIRRIFEITHTMDALRVE